MPKQPAPPRFDGMMKPMTIVMGSILKPLMKSPLHSLVSKQYLEISFTGRKSGKRYKVVTAYKHRGSSIEIISPGKWWKNLEHDAANVRVLLRGNEYPIDPETFYQSSEVPDAYRHVFTVSASTAKLYGVRRNADGSPDDNDVSQATSTCALIRFPNPT